MTKKRNAKYLVWLCVALMAGTIFSGANPSQAFTQGETYDKNNYQTVKDQLIPPVLTWLEKGEIILQTGTLDYDLAIDGMYQKLSQKNEANYDVNADGVLVQKDTGKQAEFVLGNPFPTIDPKDPKAGAKILENFSYLLQYRLEGSHGTGTVRWHSPTGLEREILSQENYLYYQNRENGPMKNPNNFLFLMLDNVPEPFDLRGTVLMSWTYADARTDVSFAYVPMLRRVRRVPSATRSDPWLGSDMCVDDMYAWCGKNAGVTWKLVGDHTFLCPFADRSKVIMKTFPNGSITRTHFVEKRGYEVPGWKGNGYMPANYTWVARDCWIVEGIPKDPYYNYAKMVFYIDKENYATYAKVIYNYAGEYWKTLLTPSSCYETDTGVRYIGIMHVLHVQDDKTHHASTADVGVDKYAWHDRFKVPAEEYNEQFFTESNMRQMSK